MFYEFHNPLTDKWVKVVPTMLRDGIAGYSKDGTKIYVDVLVPAWMLRPLLSHEVFEMVLTQQLGFKYEWAHQQATILERYVCEKLGFSWEEYDKTYRKILETIYSRNPKPVNPPDLDVHT